MNEGMAVEVVSLTWGVCVCVWCVVCGYICVCVVEWSGQDALPYPEVSCLRFQ